MYILNTIKITLNVPFCFWPVNDNFSILLNFSKNIKLHYALRVDVPQLILPFLYC